MTRDEVLAQARVGDVVAVKMTITEPAKDNAFLCRIEERHGACFVTGRWLRIRAVDIVGFIERSPETDAEKIARLEARVAELEASRTTGLAQLISNAHPWATVAELEVGK